ncbi:MAG: ABC transporter ATP-binding protein/permease [Lachnospiraceae bacterium]|nr:ABC transporter ATP-binding protein/permease [Lachnospiraceae bacterium]
MDIRQLFDKELREKLWKRVKWIYGYSRKHIFGITIFTLTGLVSTVVSALSALITRDLVDIITGHRTGELIKYFVLMMVVRVLILVINNISSTISIVISTRVENEIKAGIYEELMTLDWESMSQFHSGNIGSRWNGDCGQISNGIISIIPGFIIMLCKFGVALYLIVSQDISFIFFALANLPVSLFVSKKNLKRLKAVNEKNFAVSAKMTSFSQDSFSNIQNVKALDLIKVYSAKLKELQKETWNIRILYQKINLINSMIMTLASQVMSNATYFWGIYRVWSGVISYGSLTMFLSLSNQLTGNIQSLINYFPSTVSFLVATGRVMEIIDLPKEDYSQTEEVKAFADRNRECGVGISLKDVDFTYVSGTEVMDSVSMEAWPREIIGLVGPSGEGKTTTLRLLLAIINAKGGEAKVVSGDRNESMDITASTRQLFAYVPQGNSMFPHSIADNMRLVKEDATDEEIIAALKMACAWDFVSKLPDGIETELKEHGGGLSEGQSQRLSIARALVRKAPILLLDEATSALDMKTQKMVIDNIISADYPRTVIVTTHRKEVMDICDRVYEIENKKLSEKATY